MPTPIATSMVMTGQHDVTIQHPRSGVFLRGQIQVPGDKSISHRALMLGAIAHGETRIQGLLLGADVRSTARCLQALGVHISELTTTNVTVQGLGWESLKEPDEVLDAGNSGTTLRLMLGIIAAQAQRFISITGDRSLRSRPMSRVVTPLRHMGAQIWGRQHGSLAPLAVQGQRLQPIHYSSPVASAQVKSCILLAGLAAEGQTTVTEPALSRDHSERMLKAFGAEVTTDAERFRVTITGPGRLQGQSVRVPGDISSAAFWLVAASVLPGSDLTIEHVGINPTRTGILDALWMMGADITVNNQHLIAGEPVADLRVRYCPLNAIRIAGELTLRLIDEIPIMTVAALFAKGTTVIQDAGELRVKESDRLAVMATQLNRMGANLVELPDGLEIQGNASLIGADLDSHDDHRIAMSLAVAALRASGTTTIQQATAASIS